MPTNKLTDDDYEEIIDMIKAGYKYRIIGTKFGVDESRIRQIKKERGIVVDVPHFVRSFDSTGKAYDADSIKDMCDKYKSGMTASQIAKEYGVSYNKIYCILRKYGIMQSKEYISEQLEKDICKLYNMGINIDIIQKFLRHKNTDISISKISECLRRNGIKSRRYIPQKDIYIRYSVHSLKTEYNLSNEDISVIVGVSTKQVRRYLLDYKNTESQT